MRNQHDIRAPAFYYQLEAQDDDPFESEEGPWTISGIAVGEDSILRTDSGTPVLFSGDVLEAAAETQANQPLSKDHPSDEDGQPAYPPPTDDTVGKVQKAGYKPGKGLVYEAVVHDAEIAKGIEAGSYEVSVHPTWDGFSEQDESTGAYKPGGLKFLDLSVVSRGMDRANQAAIGPSKELAAWARKTDIGAELTASTDGGALSSDREGVIASTVSGTLRALGFNVDEVDDLGGEVTASESDEGAESSTESSSDGPSMDRNKIIQMLSDEHGFDQEWLEDADDDHLERLNESLVESDGNGNGSGSSTDNPTDPSGGDGGGGSDGGKTLGEMSPDEAVKALSDHFVTPGEISDAVQEAEAQETKRQKAEEIVARSDDYDADDVEDLVASADALVDREFERVRGETAAQLPGGAGALTASAPSGGSDEDWKEYNTGLADQEGDD
ncbi:hypothetical protein [Haloferax volcanii]|uniref:hypothetical protein n=1 Tax=Haloferax volcanii TaxID=2246 RepID=UPI00249C9CDA|nr:hypothetical protein [Haloferax alexandrinus]WEL29860.1 hypothetical protein HBNXHx_1754 [Haloferax alexandrinus]